MYVVKLVQVVVYDTYTDDADYDLHMLFWLAPWLAHKITGLGLYQAEFSNQNA